jgi:hypothetical protein
MIQVGDKFEHEKHGRVTVQRFHDEIVGVDTETGEKQYKMCVEFSHMAEYSTSMFGGRNSMRHQKTQTVNNFMESVEGV